MASKSHLLAISCLVALVFLSVLCQVVVGQDDDDVGRPAPNFMASLKKLRQNRMNETEFRLKILEIHNNVRRLHNAPDVTINEALCANAGEEATRKAAQWAANRKFDNTQDPDRSFNDNIWATESVSTTKLRAEKVLAPWLLEEKNYDYKQNYFKENTGHFSQMIWKSTDEIGIGWAQNRTIASPRKYIYIVVVRYTPPGNILDVDAFSENISPAEGGRKRRSLEVTFEV